jgi:hypothetical protein
MTLQAGIVARPARIVRTGIMALALTAAGIGFFGGSAFADGPRTIGQATNTQLTQTSTQTTQINKTTLGNSNFGKVNINKVMAAKVSATAGGSASQETCDKLASWAEGFMNDSNAAAEAGDWELSFELAKQADTTIEKGSQNGGCKFTVT